MQLLQQFETPIVAEDGNRYIVYLYGEKEQRLVVRRTEEGTDWLILTEEGLAAAGLPRQPHRREAAIVDRPKSVR
jgi:hypothetical protein